MILKIISYGLLFNGPDSYLKSPWNILDFIIVISTSINEFMEFNKVLNKMKIMRVIRSLLFLLFFIIFIFIFF